MINKKGLALLFTLGMLLITVILANIVLSLISNQSRFTHHKISRIQAYYAVQGGVNYALSKLRRQDDVNWPIPTTNQSYTRTFCASGCDVAENNLPISIQQLGVTISGDSVAGCNPPAGVSVCVNSTATYTYVNP